MPIVTTDSPVDTSGDSTLSSLTADQLAVISKGLYDECTIGAVGIYTHRFLMYQYISDSVSCTGAVSMLRTFSFFMQCN